MSHGSFQLQENRWYAWEMLPGYSANLPYFSPIFIKAVKPLRSGKGILHLGFFNALYAEGVQDFSLDLKIIKRADDYLLGEIIYRHEADSGDRTGIISPISFEWLSFVLPEYMKNHPPRNTPDMEEVDSYLSRELMEKSRGQD